MSHLKLRRMSNDLLTGVLAAPFGLAAGTYVGRFLTDPNQALLALYLRVLCGLFVFLISGRVIIEFVEWLRGPE